MSQFWVVCRDDGEHVEFDSLDEARAHAAGLDTFTTCGPHSVWKPCAACLGTGVDRSDPEQPDQCDECGGTGRRAWFMGADA